MHKLTYPELMKILDKLEILNDLNDPKVKKLFESIKKQIDKIEVVK